ncbi:MAG: DUF86 domain-containing protein [Bacteroidota bacterium]
MYDKELASELIGLIIDNIETVKKRTAAINSSNDFTQSESGMILLDSVCMKLAAIGETIKNLDKVTNKELLKKYSQVNWKQAMGMRDIIVHHYFDVDAEVIYKTLKEDVPLLYNVLNKIKEDL